MLPLFLALLAPAAHAGDDTPAIKTTVDGQVRDRLYLTTGQDFVDGVSTSEVNQRARLGVTLQRTKDDATFHVAIQDVRAWGSEADTLKDFSADGLDFHEAWGQVSLGGGSTLRLGRQEIIFNNHRLIGNVGWTQQARSFDAVRFDRKGDAYTFTAFAASLSADMKQLLGGAQLAWNLDDAHQLDVVALGRTLDPDTRHTFGVHFTGKEGALDYTLEGYGQIGKESNKSVQAWMAAANFGGTADTTGKPGLHLRAEALSGDGTPQGTFDTMYATNHKFYGEMDFFLAIGPHTGFRGLMDLGGVLSAVPADGLKVSANVHNFRAMDTTNATDFGNEVDLKVVGKVAKGVKVDALYGIFMPGEAMGEIRGIASNKLQNEQLFFLTTDIRL